MHDELRIFAIRQIISIILLTIVWISMIGIYGILISILMIALFYYTYKKESERLDAGLPRVDERTLMIAGKTGMAIFRVMLFWFIGLLFYHILTDIPTPIAPRLTVPVAIISSIIVMMATTFIANYYYDKQGDFE